MDSLFSYTGDAIIATLQPLGNLIFKMSPKIVNLVGGFIPALAIIAATYIILNSDAARLVVATRL